MKTLNQTIANIAFDKNPFIISRVLGASTAETINVPESARYVILAPTVDSWVDVRATAVVPAADIDNGNSPIFIPGGYKEVREIDGVKTISVISSFAGIFTAEFCK